MVISIVVIIFLLMIWMLVKSFKKISISFLNVFYIAFYTFQLLVAIVLVALYPEYTLGNGVVLKDAIFKFSISLFLASLGIFVVVSNTKYRYYIPLSDKLQVLFKVYSLNSISFLFAILFSFSLISSIYSSYVIAVFTLTFSFVSILIGFIYNRLNFLNRALWVFLLCVNLLFHTMQGSRGSAVFPILFMVAGYLMSISYNKTLFRKQIIKFTILLIVFFPFFSFVADFRTNVGRGLDVSRETFEVMLDFAQNDHIMDEESSVRNSLGRTLIAANVVTPYMSPSNVPYRGFYGMKDELLSIFSLAGDEGNSMRADIGYGTGVAINYGFIVNDATSVEWPILADAFSRFGYLGVFFYSFLFAMLCGYMERRCNKSYKKYPLIASCSYFFLIYNGVLSYMYPYYSFLKLFIFRFPLMLILILILNNFFKKRSI